MANKANDKTTTPTWEPRRNTVICPTGADAGGHDHHRRSIRLKWYDYSQAGLYFITICTQHRSCLFGEINDGEMILNDAGKMIKQTWHEIPVYYHGFDIHQFVIMPNHIHGIIEITADPVGATPRGCPNSANPQKHGRPAQQGQPALQGIPAQQGQPRGVAPTGLGDIVHRYKTLTTKRYIDGVKTKNWRRFNKKLWQRNYYEHIIRHQESYREIAEYVCNNPLKWQEDTYYG